MAKSPASVRERIRLPDKPFCRVKGALKLIRTACQRRE
jgi:hypothetical protein